MKPKRPQDDAPDGLVHNPFAALRPQGAAPIPETAPQPTGDEAPAAAGGGKLVVQREKRGRAGKTVTRVSGLVGDPEALALLARELKRALGCGASVEGTDVILQGAQTERAAKWLREQRGARVTIGN
ncbi:translation initiation factor [Engelhardtia mirabilis]|uniref:Translation initiation factor Sui1 n=1 Tax=Engelhardtia mirabilis TaxID=2528011 RepID=A0A518BEH1_9BACT|nr:translation initiation factor Sui1 [Planctomycetes bacterium Pla133]QDU99668.1 translation initiation factor Sui1 [Planctomycetes bacterium Pla86]